MPQSFIGLGSGVGVGLGHQKLQGRIDTQHTLDAVERNKDLEL